MKRGPERSIWGPERSIWGPERSIWGPERSIWGPERSILVVGHPNVVPHNQLVYIRLAELGWRLRIIVPNRWVDEYSPDGFTPQPYDERVQTFARVRVMLPGQYQRHFYVTDPTRWLRRWKPDVAFMEHEPFAVPAFQWGVACERLGIPWGLQGDENLDRPFPLPAKLIRAWVTPRAHFYAARSPAGGEMLRAVGGAGADRDRPAHDSRVASRARAARARPRPPPPRPRPPPRHAHDRFTIGYAGRLVPQKGIDDLLEAARRLRSPSGCSSSATGPLRERVEAADLGPGRARAADRSAQR